MRALRFALALASLALLVVLSGCGGAEEESGSPTASLTGETIAQLRENASESELSFLHEHRSELEEEARDAGYGEALERAKSEAGSEAEGDEESEGAEREFGESVPQQGETEGEEEVEYGEDGEPVPAQGS